MSSEDSQPPSDGPMSVRVGDIMTRSLITVNPATTVFQIARMMEQAGIGAVLVKEDEAHVGIMTDRDFATKIAAGSLPFDTPVQKVMSSPLITIGHDKLASEAAVMMGDKKIRKLAVSDNGRIVGIITSTDLVNQVAK